jgi:hypothetical protein
MLGASWLLCVRTVYPLATPIWIPVILIRPEVRKLLIGRRYLLQVQIFWGIDPQGRPISQP